MYVREQVAIVSGMVALSLVLCGAAAVVAGPDEAPKGVVQETADAVVAVLAQPGQAAEEKRRKVERIVYAHFDFDTLARLVLARNWKQLSAQQQKQFVEEFKAHLAMTYGRKFESYTDERVVVTGDRQERDGDWTVTSKVVRRGRDDIRVDYRLRRGTAGWKVIDVVIEGVSLVANFRAQFEEIVSNEGPSGLINLLREKNASGEPLKAS